MTDLSTPVPGWEFQLQHFSAEARQLQPEIVSMPANPTFARETTPGLILRHLRGARASGRPHKVRQPPVAR